MPAESEEPELVRWRPWPCESCRGGAALIDYILRRHETGGEISGGSEDEIIEEMIARERAWIVEWVEHCEHTRVHSDPLARLDEGSEHIVYLAPGGKEVVKLTKEFADQAAGSPRGRSRFRSPRTEPDVCIEAVAERTETLAHQHYPP